MRCILAGAGLLSLSMLRFAANLSMLYTEWPFLERYAQAAQDGFAGVECLFPYAHPAAEVAAYLHDAGVQQVLINAPPGDWAAGDKGLAGVPGQEAAFKRSIDTALHYAQQLRCHTVHVMAGLVPQGLDRRRARACYVKNLAWAAAHVAAHELTLTIEPINPRDVPGYLLNHQAEAHDICAEVGAQNLRVQMDFYHCQIVEGDLQTKLQRYVSNVAHMQIAGVPDRHEPIPCEIHYAHLFAAIEASGYRGWIGCEYHPRAGTRAGLDWIAPWLAAAPRAI